MNTLISTPVKTCIKLALILCCLSASADGWKLDLSRRNKELTRSDLAGVPPEGKDKSIFENLFNASEPLQEIVVLNTEKGFVPATLRLREGQSYNIHVVNVNEREKNVSFVMDAFSEHHATFYGKLKSFQVKPQKEGIYTFVCPETAAQGRVVVYPPLTGQEVRSPASEE